MSEECVNEANGRINGINVTVAGNDDDKQVALDGERTYFSVESKNKVEKLKNVCQHYNEISTSVSLAPLLLSSVTTHSSQKEVENLKSLTDKKNGIVHNSNENLKRQRTVCYDFKKGICRRRFCRVSDFRVISFGKQIIVIIDSFCIHSIRT